AVSIIAATVSIIVSTIGIVGQVKVVVDKIKPAVVVQESRAEKEARKLYQKAEKLSEQGKHSEAISVLENALDILDNAGASGTTTAAEVYGFRSIQRYYKAYKGNDTDRKYFEITGELSKGVPLIRQEDVLKVIRDWLEIKGKVFGRPPNRQLLSEYTTGAYYHRTQGTIDWLSSNRAYYTFEKSSVELVGNFQLSGKRAEIDVRAYESSTLYHIGGVIDPSASFDTQGVYRFTLEFSNGKWKIANATTLD
ncbi:MAG: DUF4101 domain-containing protein, partial [Okeania sp. SIO2D1]|nr:DUF4101 domain-containing protein [Okeania sp. SIO2D1]